MSEDLQAGSHTSKISEYASHSLDILPPQYTAEEIYRPDVLETIEQALDRLSPALRDLSLKIHSHPEISFEEKYAHDTLTEFMESSGFKVTRHYLGLETAWRAEFKHGTGGRVIGVNSEMDALPGIGHACGHNLIAIVGVAISLGLKAVLTKHDIPGKIVLLGTPGEESGAGKAILIERGGYKDMDVCLMAHPGAGPLNCTGTGPCKATQSIFVDYRGQTAHASAAPWEGKNALDAAVIGYSSMAALRQQIEPTHRAHAIIKGENWAYNIIPDNAKIEACVRAPTWKEAQVLKDRVLKCFTAAADATDTTCTVTLGESLFDLKQNPLLASEYSNIIAKYGIKTIYMEGAIGGSTDFGNVTYVVPGLHPAYTIPTLPNGKNHTKAFTDAARTEEAHNMSISVAKALAHTGFHVIDDDAFYSQSTGKDQTAHPQATVRTKTKFAHGFTDSVLSYLCVVIITTNGNQPSCVISRHPDQA
ncbi:hypothetical protein Clacol_000226 [Clathrus columnatus]|uniref:Peptidase M20 dimerisation domain-containing protein n=1 Tax=Clathrus columnatus TaxID=1419009 RepID=A0AAV5A049_9AGAM|nr:hypothetical protein Clacol_000226 [Clathrus columnatus]